MIYRDVKEENYLIDKSMSIRYSGRGAFDGMRGNCLHV